MVALPCSRGETGVRLLTGRDADRRERVEGESGRKGEEVSESERLENDRGGVDEECLRVRADYQDASVTLSASD